jgi:hypothetical protein
LKLLNVIELQYVSPRLMAVRDLDIAVPGTYASGKPIIGIQYVLPTFQVINSKQRPRKFSMRGLDGKDYTYCLKGGSGSPSAVVMVLIVRTRGSATGRASYATLWTGQHATQRRPRMCQATSQHSAVLRHASIARRWSSRLGAAQRYAAHAHQGIPGV